MVDRDIRTMLNGSMYSLASSALGRVLRSLVRQRGRLIAHMLGWK
jgi:hypothetical protein